MLIKSKSFSSRRVLIVIPSIQIWNLELFVKNRQINDENDPDSIDKVLIYSVL